MSEKPPASDPSTFQAAFGEAMMEWSRVEVMLGIWFRHVTHIPTWATATAVFFSAKSFSGRADMLKAALEHSLLKEDQKELVDEVLLKAIAYNGFRNRLAHGVAMSGDDALAEGKQWWKGGDIDLAKLQTAAANFRKLRQITYKAHCHCVEPHKGWPTLAECLQQLQSLPSEPYFMN